MFFKAGPGSRGVRVSRDCPSRESGTLSTAKDPNPGCFPDMTQTNQTASPKFQPLTTNEDLAHVRVPQSTRELNTSLHSQRASPLEPILIPNEIWAEIFVWYADLWCTFRATAPSSSAWRLGRVCREWRNLALSMPQLWDHPPVVRLAPESLKGGYFRTGWEVFLRRSGTLPLKLHLSFEFFVNIQFLTPFFDHVNRWEHLTISGLTVMQAQLRFQKIFKRLPLLRSVTLNFAPTTSDLDYCPSFDIFEFAPKLTHINLHSPSTSFLKSRLRFPWKQLTNYNESGIDMGTFPVLLDSSHHLETLQYRGRNFTYISTEPLAQFRLRHLIVETKEIAQFWRQLENVTLPALKTFSVRALRPTLERLPHIPTLTDFIARSGCPLKKLVLDFGSGPFDHVAMKGLFSCLDDLESLELGDCHDSTRTMSLLKFEQDERTLLPRLRSLTLHDHEGFKDASIISDLALSRERSVAGETSPERLLAALEYIRVVTPKIYGRHNAFCKLSATDSAAQVSPVYRLLISANKTSSLELDRSSRDWPLSSYPRSP